MDTLRAASSDSDRDVDTLNMCRIICRLFAETAEHCIDLFVSPSVELSLNPPSYAQSLVTQLLECAQFPFTSADPNICKAPLKFFYDLSLFILNYAEPSNQSNNFSGIGNSNSNGILSSKYTPVFVCLLEVAVQQMTLPDSTLIHNEPLSEEVEEMRSCWKETVLDCCSVLGGFCSLDVLCKLLQSEIEASSSRPMHYSKVESILFSIQLIASWIPQGEDRYLPTLIAFLGSLTSLDQLVHLQVTVIDLYGLLTFWFSSNPSALMPVIQKLLVDLSHPQKSLAASRTLMLILRRCSGIPGLPVMELAAHVQTLRVPTATSPLLSMEADLNILEGIACALSNHHSSQDAREDPFRAQFIAESENAFKEVVSPVAEEIHRAAHSPPPSVQVNQVVLSIDRLAVLLRHYRSEGSAVVDVLVSVIPLFQLLLRNISSERLCERVCRCYKYALRNAGVRFLPTLPAFTSHLAQQFSVTPVAAFLYAGKPWHLY